MHTKGVYTFINTKMLVWLRFYQTIERFAVREPLSQKYKIRMG